MNRIASEYKPRCKLLADRVTAVAKREAVALTSGRGKSVDSTVFDKWLQPPFDMVAYKDGLNGSKAYSFDNKIYF